MTGLEKIIFEIEQEAKSEAAATIAKARQNADNILASAKAESDALAASIAADAARDIAEIERSRDSAAQLQRRQRTLQTKQLLLSETLNQAREALYGLPETEYFVLLVKLAVANAQQGEGEMLLNEKDKQRLPAGFEPQMAQALPAGATLKVSANTRPIDGGFVLKYGDVEENCSFNALFDARRDMFFDLVRDTLFG